MSKFLFTVDLEEWWGVESLRKFLPENVNEFDDRIDIGVDVILELLGKYKIKATFFTLGRVAKKHKETIKKIYKAGHTIGTHGQNHTLISNQTQNEFEKDLAESIKILSEITETNISCYRAPSYSIKKETLWVLPILKRNGIKIDSSIVPGNKSRYGIDDALKTPYRIIFKDEDIIIEIPPFISTIFKIPVTSGIYLRNIPNYIIKKELLKAIKSKIPVMFVIHNWELDPAHPKIKGNFKSEIIHYSGLKAYKQKLQKIFDEFSNEFISLDKFDFEYKNIKFGDSFLLKNR